MGPATSGSSTPIAAARATGACVPRPPRRGRLLLLKNWAAAPGCCIPDDDHNLEDAIRVVLIGERNHEDSARKATNVARGMRKRKVERGLHNGGPEKLGYRFERDQYGNPIPGRPKLIDPAGARIVRRIFDQLDAGISQNQTARDLNDDGVPTPAGGARWYPATVRLISHDPYYAGLLRTDGPRHRSPDLDTEFADGQHDAIVLAEREEQALQKIVRARRHPAITAHCR